MAIYEERMKALNIAYDMERRGVTVSKKRVKEIYPKYKKRSQKLGRELQVIAADYDHDLELPKRGVNNSVRSFLLDILQLEPIYNKKTEGPSLDKDAMLHYDMTLPVGSVAHNYIKRHIKKSKYDSAMSYIAQYVKYWHETDDPDTCLLHPNLNMTGTDTLRWSHSNPNSANIGKDTDEEGSSLRTMFGPAPGREWWSFDFKNVELRIPAYEANEREMIALFERPNEPPYYGSNHILNFHTVYPDLWEDGIKRVGIEKLAEWIKSKEGYKATWYQYVKNGGFAIQYNAGITTADKAFHRDGCHTKLKQRFARLEELNQYWISYAEKHGYVETLKDKRVSPDRGYPILVMRGFGNRIEPTKPLNYHVQSTAMWLTMCAMIKVEEVLAQWRREGFDAYITLQVHDELVIDMPRRMDPRQMPSKSNLGRARLIQSLMASCGDDLVPVIPTPVGSSYHPDNWGAEIAF